MVQLPGKAELDELRGFGEPFCLTIYVPHVQNDQAAAVNPNRIELKNLLREAETALQNDGVAPRDIKKTLRPVRELLDTHEFWPMRPESLALYAHPNLFRTYHLPGDAVPYMLSVGRGFKLGPLLEVLRANRPYVLLTLSHNNVQLYRGDRFGLKKLRFKNLPPNLEQALRIDEYPNETETHPIAAGSAGKGSEAFHGQYNENQTNKKMLLEFFQLINDHLHRFLQEKRLPLVLAGVEYLLPIYRQANTSPYLLDEGITGNMEREQPEALRDRAWALVAREAAV